MNERLRAAYEAILPLVDKPARYVGGELGAVSGEAKPGDLRFALAFPEVYEIAQSHLGYQILYDLLNRREGIRAERVYAPWVDLEERLREAGLPLVSLETFTPLSDFDVVGVSLQYELTFTNVVNMLELGGLPLLAADRADGDPIVVAGGPVAFNPEPIADFLDAVVLGDAEEAILEVAEIGGLRRSLPRAEVLERLSEIPGVYVPSRFSPSYDDSGRLLELTPVAGQRSPVRKRILEDLGSVPPRQIHVTPNTKIVHDRANVEVMRGCVKGCRFCQAGYIYRPLRERPPEQVTEAVESLVERGGYDEVSLLSLSTADYSCVNPVLSSVVERFADERVAVSLPSTRVEALSPKILEEIRRVRKTGFTLAPEAGTQRMRDIIQKEYTEEELLDAASTLFGMGWRHIKLYFMCGLPGETEEDLRGIAELAERVSQQAPNGRGHVTASVSNFVPKPHTPFQWVSQVTLEETIARQNLIRRECRHRRVDFRWHDARLSFLEGIFSRGDRRLGSLVLEAHRRGCRFDGWSETFNWDAWREAIEATGMDSTEWFRRRELGEALPWDHLDSGVTKKWLQGELARAVEGRLTPDCSIDRCTYCGACDFQKVRNVDYHRSGSKGSDHRGAEVEEWASDQVDGREWATRSWQKITARKDAKAERMRARREGTAVGEVESEPTRRPASTADVMAPSGLAEFSKLEVGDEATVSATGNADEWLEGDPSALPSPGAAKDSIAVARYRLRYRKHGGARFLGGLEVQTLYHRAARRAHLPVAYSAGHHPMPRFAFGPALPVGAESEVEHVDLSLTENWLAEELLSALSAELPAGVEVLEAQQIPLGAPSIDSTIESTAWRLDLESLPLSKRDAGYLRGRVAACDDLELKKRGKRRTQTVRAADFVRKLALSERSHLEVELASTERGSLKPSALLEALLELDRDESRQLRWTKVSVAPDPTEVVQSP